MGVMEKHDPIGKLQNKHGKIQSQLKFGITDGRYVFIADNMLWLT